MQDNDESRESLRKGLPVVSCSIGDSAEFLYGDERNVEKADSVLLESGDVLIFEVVWFGWCHWKSLGFRAEHGAWH